MKAINRRHLVTFQSRDVIKDSYGQKKESFSDLKTLYAEVDSEQADDRGYERDVNQTKITVTCRPVTGLMTGDRVVYEGKSFNITNIRPKSRTMREVEAEEIV